MFNRKTVAKAYILSYFFIDLVGCLPVGLFKAIPQEQSKDDLHNILTFNFAYIPRLYIVFLTVKLTRIRKFKKPFIMFMKKVGIGVDRTNLSVTLWTLVLMLHLISCLWGVSGTFNLDSNVNWIIAADLQNQNIIYHYVTSLYWAA